MIVCCVDSSNDIVCYCNCQILRGGALEQGEIWVQNGEIIDPTTLVEHYPKSTIEYQCLIASPGFINLLVKGKSYAQNYKMNKQYVEENNTLYM